MKVRVYSLTVDADEIFTSVHGSLAEVYESLQENFNADSEYPHPSVDLQPLMDGQGICVYIDEHEVEVGVGD